MSKGQWRRCPNTGISLKALARVSERYLTDEGYFRIDLLSDCNIYDVRSVSAACGFLDYDYFRRSILTHPDCPIHVRRQTLFDEESGDPLVEIIATHQNSAAYGGKLWRETRSAVARDRVLTSLTDVSSGSTI